MSLVDENCIKGEFLLSIIIIIFHDEQLKLDVKEFKSLFYTVKKNMR